MAVEELEQTIVRVNQAAVIIGQLEILKTSCSENGNTVGIICCQIAITALAIVVSSPDNSPKDQRVSEEELK